MSASPTPRHALLAGATGLIGSALLPLLIDSPRYDAVHVLARRPIAGIPPSPKLVVHQVDFVALPSLPAVDDVYLALGTTIKAAGSQEAFRRVDFDFVVDTARAAQAVGATRLGVVSALGANARSRVFYNRVKGEMQTQVATLGYACVVITQPSLLMGDRTALGQPVRSGEVWATRLSGPFAGWLPARLRPISASTVARVLLDAVLAAEPGVRILRSDEMQAT